MKKKKKKDISLKKPLIILICTFILLVIACLLNISLKNNDGSTETTTTTENSASGWQTVDGKTYYYDPDTMEVHKGWLDEGGAKWYLDPETGEKLTGWQTVEGKTYYLGENGKLQTGLVETDDGQYLLDPQTGVKLTGDQLVDGKLYALDEDGIVQTDVNGDYDYEGTTYYMSDGIAYTGWTAIGGSVFSFEDGLKQTDTTVDGYTLDSEGYITGEPADYIKFEAEVIVDTLTDSSMELEQKLWLCFDYMLQNYDTGTNQRIPHYTGEDWPYIYADDLFGPLNSGNCFSCGAAYAFLAKACGAEEVYACNSGGHGWAEVDGLVYDPEQYHDTDDNKLYAATYDETGIYWQAISAYENYPWMRVEITD